MNSTPLNAFVAPTAPTTPISYNTRSKSVVPDAPKKVKQTKQVIDMPQNDICPCGGGQSCIVDRRWVGDWVHEDTIFINAGLPIRKNCFAAYTNEQKKKLNIKYL